MRALADPVRLRMLLVLADGEYHPCFPEEFLVGVHKSTLSHHFRVLREAGITRTRLEGRNYFVQLRREDLDARFSGLLDAVLGGARELGMTDAPDAADARSVAADGLGNDV
ncbi:helix-turn-helix domain-containing protein [Streptomyces albireticuli]|uniref:Transcriptional regulator n=2 Tax=Streptomyces albireticuli TaxID=1940 RepID=A0A2A2D948_9ACTN|nr:helix-turn-helix domain-containing protein [Streptomyces albireticuli]MCD9144554.1 helix-turn-helix domain-containing protein [Streptomyces albireticuli]MCD9163383.1 helix-turn-helix domain-containing protein [Streptomyces albireticuli]MCD9193232.1 helix-turn-helix domain-containing protein [Streptomyces albireticuli]PAU47832.1 transcriptional regulator [Streptomyces albireticuli]